MTTVLITGGGRADTAEARALLEGSCNLIERDAAAFASALYEKADAALFCGDYEGIKALRSAAEHRRTPVIAAVEPWDREAQLLALEYGADCLAFRPLDGEVLLSTLANAIRRSEMEKTLIDPLTGLPHRTVFFETAGRMIKSQPAGYYTFSCFDIESFKMINDQYGFDSGDAVLKHVAGCISEHVDKCGGACCRYSADKFAVLYPSSERDGEELLMAQRSAIAPACINRKLRVRIGRYEVTDKALPISAMYDRAAMAEESIRGRYESYTADYTDSMRARLLSEQRIVNDMDRALADGEFRPWFQPQYNHATGALIGAEALARWEKEDGFIYPSEFIPVFERNGFIYEMDISIWEQVCALLRKWLDEGKAPLPVSVNISRRDLFHKHFIPTLLGLVNKYELPYSLLRLEVTESAFTESSGTIIAQVDELIGLGFIVEIDDFGSGYSSLNTLKDVPASILKLDMRFFENTKNQQRGGNIIESVVRMSKWLGMAVIAEGVEDKAQADYLKSIGCYYIQGYYYAKPMPACDYEKLLESSAKEAELTRLKTLETLDNNEFWNPKSMETLIFNSYIGGACIFEYTEGRAELLRVSDQYAQELGGLIPGSASMDELGPTRFLDEGNQKRLFENMRTAIATQKQSTCKLTLRDGAAAPPHVEYVRATVRVIAQAAERYLFYCVVVNITQQTVAEQRRLEAEKKLLQSARQLQFIMDNVNGGVSAIDINEHGASTLIFCNEKYYELYGYTRQDAKELDILTRVVPEDLPGVLEKVRKLKAGGIPAMIDYQITKQDGKPAYLRTNASLMSMEGHGDVMASVVTDITEQRELSDKFQALMDSISGGVSAVYTGDGAPEFVMVNDSYFDILGYTREQFESEVQDVFALIHPEDRERVKREFAQASKPGAKYTMEYRFIRRDGQVRHALCSTNVVRLFGLDAPVQLAVTTDVTDQHEEKERLRVSEEFNRIALEQSGNIITRFDVKHRTLTLPDHFSPIFELPHVLHNMPEEQIALGRVSPDTADAYRALFESIVNGSAAGKAAYKQNSSKGWRWLEAQYTTVFSSAAQPVSAVISFTDITEKLEKEVVYNKWQQSLNERPEESYTLFRCNLSANASYDSWEGALLDVNFDQSRQSFSERTEEYMEQCVYKDDRARYAAFMDSDVMLAAYYRGRRSDSIEYRESTKDGARWLRLTVDLVEYPNSKDVEAYLMYENIDEQKKAELLTLERSETDPLTGIFNRATFIERMEQLLARSMPGEKHALLMLDVDNFKHVNDTLGHGAGDQVLRDLTAQASRILRRDDLMGRLGGDEFFIFLKNIAGASSAAAKAEQLCKLEVFSGKRGGVTASIGIAVIPSDGADFDTLYKKVDAALYTRKKLGKNGYLFVSEMETK